MAHEYATKAAQSFDARNYSRRNVWLVASPIHSRSGMAELENQPAALGGNTN